MSTTTPTPTSPGSARTPLIVVLACVAGLALAAGAFVGLTSGGGLQSLFGTPTISAANGASPEELADAVVGRWGTADDGSHHYELLADGTGSRSDRDGDSRIGFTWHITDEGSLALRDLPALPDEDWAISVRGGNLLRFEDPARPEWSLSLARRDSAPSA